MWKKIRNVIGPAHEINERGEIRQCLAWKNGDIAKNVKRVPSIDRNGFLYIVFRDGTNQQNRKVHRLVANAFLPNPRNLPFVKFIDNDKNNCRVSNLKRTKLRGPVRRLGRKLDEAKVRMIRALDKGGAPRKYIADVSGVSSSMVSHIVCGRKWGWVS